jgi:acyl-CoA thioesterase FadM
MQFLQYYGYSEKDLGGVSLIMGDVAIVFKNELFYGDHVRIQVTVTDISRVSFDLVYKLEKEKDGITTDVAHAKTGMICFDYVKRKVASIPDEVKQKWSVS